MKTFVVALLFAAFASVCASAAESSSGEPRYASVTLTGSTYSIQAGKDTDAVAWGYYEETRYATGWDQLRIVTNGEYSDHAQTYAAGYLEGYFTAYLIDYAFVNMDTPVTPAIAAYLEENLAYMQAESTTNETVYWQHVGTVLSQLEGLYNGYLEYRNGTSPAISLIELISLSAAGDMEDLASLETGTIQDSDNYGGHCSVAVKVTDDLSDLLIGHTTWSNFNTMIRIYKSYELSLATPAAASLTRFSSYPGNLVSTDDFYTLNSNLVVTETTNGCMNASLLADMKPVGQLSSWVRTIVANRMAASAEEWTQIFDHYNSGTYNNQWIILDYNLFTPGKPLQPGTLWITEQMPGSTHPHDVTSYLSYGYWPSYNVPFDPYVNKVCGFPEKVVEYGNSLLSYQLAARAKIFRRDQSSVQNITDLGNLQRYNDWEHDPFSLGNPGLQISSRFDLVPSLNASDPYLSMSCFGGLDSKITSRELMVAGFMAYAQSGPTHDQQPVFNWETSEACVGVSHLGMPTAYDFDWVLMEFTTGN